MPPAGPEQWLEMPLEDIIKREHIDRSSGGGDSHSSAAIRMTPREEGQAKGGLGGKGTGKSRRKAKGGRGRGDSGGDGGGGRGSGRGRGIGGKGRADSAGPAWSPAPVQSGYASLKGKGRTRVLRSRGAAALSKRTPLWSGAKGKGQAKSAVAVAARRERQFEPWTRVSNNAFQKGAGRGAGRGASKGVGKAVGQGAARGAGQGRLGVDRPIRSVIKTNLKGTAARARERLGLQRQGGIVRDVGRLQALSNLDRTQQKGGKARNARNRRTAGDAWEPAGGRGDAWEPAGGPAPGRFASGGTLALQALPANGDGKANAGKGLKGARKAKGWGKAGASQGLVRGKALTPVGAAPRKLASGVLGVRQKILSPLRAWSAASAAPKAQGKGLGRKSKAKRATDEQANPKGQGKSKKLVSQGEPTSSAWQKGPTSDWQEHRYTGEYQEVQSGSGKGGSGGKRGKGGKGGRSSNDSLPASEDGPMDAYARVSRGSKGKGKKGRNSWSSNDKDAASALDLLTAEERGMMKKITIVAQLDKVPKPVAAMRNFASRRQPGELPGSLGSRFGANFHR